MKRHNSRGNNNIEGCNICRKHNPHKPVDSEEKRNVVSWKIDGTQDNEDEEQSGAGHAGTGDTCGSRCYTAQ